MEESVLVTSKTMVVSDRIFLKDDNERLCNICQATEIYMNQNSGVCSTCAENRFNDKIWTEEQYKLWEIDELITCADGCVHNKIK